MPLTDAMRTLLLTALKDTMTQTITHIGYGTSGKTATREDTALDGEWLSGEYPVQPANTGRSLIVWVWDDANNELSTSNEVDEDEGPHLGASVDKLGEYGYFDSVTIGGGILYFRSAFADTLIKGAGVKVKIDTTFELGISEAY